MDQHKDSLEYAFKYFELHAKQRMTVFNFFLAISGALIGLIAASLGGEDKYPLAALALSIFLLALAYLFWQLDIRTAFLIKHAEASLKISEGHLFDDHACLMGREPAAFATFRAGRSGLAKGLSYSRSLRFIFFLTASLAVVGISLSLNEIFGSEIQNLGQRMLALCQN